jgi:DivIVA domain-containing protein
MTEDSFRLTPLDIRTLQFRRTMRGYDPAAVEEFRGHVASEVENLLREKAVSDEQVRSFRDQLKSFREREKALSEALVVAEQLRQEAEEHANRQAELIIREARTEAASILSDARQAEQAVRRDIESIRRQLASYLASFRVLLERNLAEVEAVESRERNGGHPEKVKESQGTAPRRPINPSEGQPRAARQVDPQAVRRGGE